MRLPTRQSPLLLLLLPSIAAALVAPAADSFRQHGRRAVAAPLDQAELSPSDSLRSKYGGSRVAPVDGKDGRPHDGPFVSTDRTKSSDEKNLPPLKGRPEDPTIIDGKKIPETNDGVMDDRTRERPKEGTTGTEGGVSEKDKARKAQESRTGEKTGNRPETPKEAPPLPHSEEERMKESVKDKADGNSKSSGDAFGFEKPSDLPGKVQNKPNPVPDSANKDHLEVSKSGSATGKTTTKKLAAGEDADGLIQPFHSFILSLTMILFSEVGDKTFLVAALMAMKHDRAVVFSAAFGALLVMTVLSAVLGHALPALLPKRLTGLLASGLFFVFGARMLREGLAMSPDEGVTEEMHEVERELAEKEKEQGRRRRRSSAAPYALEMGLAGGHGHGAGSRRSRSKTRFPTPPRSPSTSPGRSPSPLGGGAVAAAVQGLDNLLSLLLSPAWVQTFVMTFLAEWGDRSQIATIAMAAGQDYWWVILGALLGHFACTGAAVIGGRAIAGRVSLKVVTVGGAVAFLIFGFIYLIESFYA